jgi:AmmeMemoRadiSam system protein A
MPSPLHKSLIPDAQPSNQAPADPPQFSEAERSLLLRVAHDAIEARLEERDRRVQNSTPRLAEPRGVFTTLYLHGQLRGCVGYVFPVIPLIHAVAETALSAALQDSRFTPVSREEAPHLAVSLSVLSTLFPIQPEQIQIGKHGLVVSWAGHRGLLLPQVPVEHHWDRETFLDQTCRKAGLPTSAWRASATLEAFTAEVFGDAGCPE